MKKLVVSFFLCVLLLLSCLSVQAAETQFDVVVEAVGGAVVNPGAEVTVKVSYRNITAEGGLQSSDVDLSYDASVLTYVSSTTCTVSGWSINLLTDTAGTIAFRAVDESTGEQAVSGSDVLYFTVTFRLAETAQTATSLSVTTATAVTSTFSQVNGSCGSLALTPTRSLASPTGLTLADGVASWGAVANADYYTVQLYKGNTALGTAQKVTATRYDFSSLIAENLGGAYSFRVSAGSNQAAYASSETVVSDTVNCTGQLKAPTVSVKVNKVTSSLEYEITDLNAADDVQSYILYVYEKDGTTAIAKVSLDSKKGSKPISEIAGMELGKSYRFSAVACSATAENTVTGNRSSDESARSSAVTADGIVGISVKGLPQLSYTEGDTLNLSGLSVTVTYAAGGSEEVALSNFGTYGISVSLQNGDDVLLSMNGKTLDVTCGSLKAANSPTLTVEAAECQHGNTKTERVEPTCGENGVEKQVCQLCGVTVSQTKIAATGKHTYGEWVIDVEPTATMDGARHKDCTVCGACLVEAIPSLGGETTQSSPTVTTEPSITTDPDASGTTPSATTEAPATTTNGNQSINPMGSLNDLSRIFVTVLIVIVVLIILFIILAIWLESRRNRRRRSQARTVRARNNRANGNRPNSQNGNRRPRA